MSSGWLHISKESFCLFFAPFAVEMEMAKHMYDVKEE